jgi:hypothetical protein
MQCVLQKLKWKLFKEFDMKIVYNVQVYPIYSGHINDHKVLLEREFDNKQEAIGWVAGFNELCGDGQIAVYTGMIDDETGENL